MNHSTILLRRLKPALISRGTDPRVTLASLVHPGLNSVAAPRLVDADIYVDAMLTARYLHQGSPNKSFDRNGGSVFCNLVHPAWPDAAQSTRTIVMPRASKKAAPLWRCRACGRSFANRNQTHSCSNVSLASHFTGRSEKVRELFDALSTMIKKCGPVRILPEKTRIAFQVRMSFIAVQVRRDYLIGHFVLARRLENQRFTRVESFSPRNHLHAFRLDSLAELDDEFAAWVREAYAVGEQKHLRKIKR